MCHEFTHNFSTHTGRDALSLLREQTLGVCVGLYHNPAHCTLFLTHFILTLL